MLHSFGQHRQPHIHLHRAAHRLPDADGGGAGGAATLTAAKIPPFGYVQPNPRRRPCLHLGAGTSMGPDFPASVGEKWRGRPQRREWKRLQSGEMEAREGPIRGWLTPSSYQDLPAKSSNFSLIRPTFLGLNVRNCEPTRGGRRSPGQGLWPRLRPRPCSIGRSALSRSGRRSRSARGAGA